MTRSPDSRRPGFPRGSPIPNYGRGAFFGLAAMFFGSAFWALYMAVTNSHLMLMPVVAGWFASASVKRGMGTLDRTWTATALSIYFAVMIVCLGELSFFAWAFYSHTHILSLTQAFHRLVGYFRAYPKNLLFMLLFTGLGFVVAVINCREGIKKKRKRKAMPKDGE